MKNIVLSELVKRFGTDIKELKLIHQNSRHCVYEYEIKNRKFILKTARGSGADVNLIKGELDWVNYLYDKGVNVSRAIPSTNSELVESVEVDGSHFSAYSFEKLEIENSADNNKDSDIAQKLGQIMGQMHVLAKDYKPKDVSSKRPEWYNKDWLKEPDKALHPSHNIVIEKCHDLRKKLSLFDSDKDSYGLIHDDLHMGNVIIFNGKITVIDFECCHYTWFVSDIASALYFHLWKNPNSDIVFLKQSATNFMKNLLIGYSRENHVDRYWLEQMPLFLKLREMSIYVSSGNESQDVEDIGPDQKLFFYRKHNIENDVPYIDIDFSKI